jgi:hypothetical protein
VEACRIRKKNDEDSNRENGYISKCELKNWNHANRFTERISIKVLSNNIAEFCKNGKRT